MTLDTAAFLARFDAAVRRTRRMAPGDRLDVEGGVYRLVGRHAVHLDNCVRYAVATPQTVGEVIAAQLRFFAARGHAFYWRVYGHDRPADLAAQLERAGFVRHETSALMVRDPADVAEADPPADVEVRRLEDPEALRDVARVQEAVWPDQSTAWLVDGLGRELRERPDRLSVFVAYLGAQPVACGWTRYCGEEGELGYLFGGTTREDQRRRGIYRALVAARAAEVRGRGTPFLVVNAGPASAPILERLGFERATRVAMYFSPPPSRT